MSLAERAMTARGYRPLQPGLCRDEPGAPQPQAPYTFPLADVVHLHWPEKLAQAVGVRHARELLEGLASRAAIVQTLHNPWPHERVPAEMVAFLRTVDALSDGVHAFSVAHERAARAARPALPERVLILPHPAYPDVDGAATRYPPPRPGTLGCFGRLRRYKRIAAFARAFLDEAGSTHRLLVAGYPDDPATHADLTALAADDTRLVYQPGFHDRAGFLRLMRSVEWVALPYSQVWSSGVLVTALQMHRGILSPTPVGGIGLYGVVSSRWLTVDPWDHRAAVRRWLAAGHERRTSAPTPRLDLPTWPEAAMRLAVFYQDLVAARSGQPEPSTTRSAQGRGPDD